MHGETWAADAPSDWTTELRTSGYAIIRDLITPRDVEELRVLVDKRLRAWTKAKASAGTEKAPLLTQLLLASTRAARLVRDLFWDPRIQWVLGNFHCRSVIEHTKVLVKAAGAPETPWHQDHAYFKAFDPSGTMITLWSPFHEVSADNGSLRVTHGEQPRHLLPHEVANDEGELAIRSDALAPFLSRGVVNPSLRPGDAILFTSRVVHGTYPNSTVHARLAFKLVFQDLERRSVQHPLRDRSVAFHGVAGVINRLQPCALTRLRLQPKLWKTQLRSRLS